MFFGVVFNAASSVATMLQGIIKSFTFNTTAAFRPQIIKKYATGDYDEMIKLMNTSLSLAIFLSLLISLPLFIETDYLMKFWLVNPPTMAPEFARLLIVSALFAMMTVIFTIGIEATGHNKQVNIYTGTIYMLTIPVMYILFRMGSGVLFSYYCIIGANVVIFLSNIVIFKFLMPKLHLLSCLFLILRSFIVAIVSILPAYLFVNQYVDECFFRLVINIIITVGIYLCLSYFVILDSSSREFLRNKMLKLFKNHRH